LAGWLILLNTATNRAETIFLADFDQGFDAIHARGARTALISPDAHSGDVALAPGRFGQGVFLKRKIPSLALSYETRDNFPLKEGAIEFWFRAEWDGTWREPDGPPHCQGRPTVHFVVTSGSPTGFRLVKTQYNVYDFHYARNYDRSNAQVQTLVHPWKKGAWQFYAVSWDVDEARLFLNGRLMAVSGRWKPGAAIGPRLVLGAARYGIGRFGGAWGTFDDLRISDHKRYVSSFPVPVAPLAVDAAPGKESAAREPAPAGPADAGARDVLFRVDYTRSLTACVCHGDPVAFSNGPLERGPDGVRLRRPAKGPGATLCYRTGANADRLLGTADVTLSLDRVPASPVCLLDLTELAPLVRQRARGDGLRTGMRLSLTKDHRLRWVNLEDGRILGQVSSPPLTLAPDRQTTFSMTWGNARVVLTVDGESVADTQGVAMASRLAPFLFVGSDSRGENTVEATIRSVEIRLAR